MHPKFFAQYQGLAGRSEFEAGSLEELHEQVRERFGRVTFVLDQRKVDEDLLRLGFYTGDSIDEKIRLRLIAYEWLGRG